MKKVMFIIDEPKTCEDCPCIQSEMDYETIRYNYCGLDFHEIEKYSKRDTNCPLRQIPKKKYVDIELARYCEAYDKAIGWNECISEIEKELGWYE